MRRYYHTHIDPVKITTPVDLETAQSLVAGPDQNGKGFIAIISLHYGGESAQLIVNEEGLPLNLVLNSEASKLFSRNLWGPVIFLSGEDRLS